jgi:hypothetical protein
VNLPLIHLSKAASHGVDSFIGDVDGSSYKIRLTRAGKVKVVEGLTESSVESFAELVKLALTYRSDGYMLLDESTVNLARMRSFSDDYPMDAHRLYVDVGPSCNWGQALSKAFIELKYILEDVGLSDAVDEYDGDLGPYYIIGRGSNRCTFGCSDFYWSTLTEEEIEFATETKQTIDGCFHPEVGGLISVDTDMGSEIDYIIRCFVVLLQQQGMTIECHCDLDLYFNHDSTSQGFLDFIENPALIPSSNGQAWLRSALAGDNKYLTVANSNLNGLGIHLEDNSGSSDVVFF